MIYTDGVHLVGNELEELHAFAQSVGLKPQWFQYQPNHPHYDITTSRMRKKIINTNKVIMVSTKRLITICRGKNE